MSERRLLTLLAARAVVLALVLASPARATQLSSATLNGASKRPTPVATTATGSLLLSHGPADANGTAAPIIDLTHLLPAPPIPSRALTSSPANATLTLRQVIQLKTGPWNFNVHSGEFPGGEIRGQIAGAPHAGLLLAAGVAGLALRRRRAYV
jgi:hypothetical protein